MTSQQARHCEHLKGIASRIRAKCAYRPHVLALLNMGKRKADEMQQAAEQKDKDSEQQEAEDAEASQSEDHSSDYSDEEEDSDGSDDSAPEVSDEGEEDSPDEDPFDKIDVNFEFFDPKEQDFHGLKALLHTYLDGQQYDNSQLVDTIIAQVGNLPGRRASQSPRVAL